MKILKTLMVVIVITIFLLFLFIKFSTVSTNYLCTENSSTNTSKKLLFLNIKKHHRWADWLTISSGNITYKIPLKESGIYNNIVQKQNILQMFNYNEKSIQGTYSELNNKLFIKTASGTFEGKCEVLNNHCSNNIMH